MNTETTTGRYYPPEYQGPYLTDEQLAEVKEELVRGGGDNCRFTYAGRGLRIEDGYRYPKGTNVMHQAVYWTMTKATAKKVAAWLGEGVKAHWHSREA